MFKGPRNIENGIWISLIIGPNQNQFAKKNIWRFPNGTKFSMAKFVIFYNLSRNTAEYEKIGKYLLPHFAKVGRG